MESLSNKLSFSEQKSPFVEIEEKVRYSETDQMGVAHNKCYFEWFEIGRTEYCRNKGMPYKEIEARGYYLVVVEAFCRYKKSLKYDENFLIRVSLKEITQKKAVFNYEMLSKKDKKLVASGYTIHIATDAKSNVCTLPPDIINKLL